MIIPHEPWLVALSIAIAIQGSFVGLSLARGIDSAAHIGALRGGRTTPTSTPTQGDLG